MKTMAVVRWVAKTLACMALAGCGASDFGPGDPGSGDGAVTLAACSGDTGAERDQKLAPYELIISGAFTPFQQETIEMAAEAWLEQGATLGRIFVERAGPSPGWDGAWDGETIWIKDTIELVWTVSLHEMGHAAGAEHHWGYGVMAERPTASCISSEDLALIGIDGHGTCPDMR